MRKSIFIAGSLSLTVLALAASPAIAKTKYISWQGTWHLNKTETHYPAGVLVSDNDLVVSVDDGKTLKYVETVVNDGKTDTQTYDGAYDNTPYDIKNGETMTFRHISANSYGAVRHNKDGFVTERSVFVLSHHGKKLTCHVWAAAPGGKAIKFDEIFDKAE